MLPFKLAEPASLVAASPVQEAFVGTDAFRRGHCAPGFIMMPTKWLDEHSDPDDETIKHHLSRCEARREVLEAVKLGARKRTASASGTAGAAREGPRS